MVLDKYNLVFEKGLKKLKGTTQFHIDPQTKPVFEKPTPFNIWSDPKLKQS